MFDAYTLNNAVQYALPEEIHFLEELGAELNVGQIVMIGAGPGVLGLAALRDYQLSGREHPDFTVVDNYNIDYIQAHFAAAGLRIAAHKKDSASLGTVWNGGEIGLLIVDGDHSELGVLRDLYAWLPHVTPCTHLFFHDYLERAGGFNGVGKWKRGGVAKAIDHFPQITVFEQVGISAYCRLKEDI